VASRVHIAAAACVVASGLFVAGSPAPIASAGPDRGLAEGERTHDNGGHDGDRRAGPLRDFGRGRGPESRGRGRTPVAGWQIGKRVLREIRIAPQTKPTKPGEDWPPTKPHRPWWMDCDGGGGGVGQPPGNPGSGGGGGNGGGLSTSRPPTLPSHLPPTYGGLPSSLPGASAEPFVGPGIVAAGAAAAPLAPIALPAIVVPVALPGGLAGGAGPRPGVPGAVGRPNAEPPPARQSPPSSSRAGQEASPNSAPASTYRAGYGSYLRSAGPGEIAALAVPGFVGILLLTGAGGLIGYRQARAGRAIRAGAMERFMS